MSTPRTVLVGNVLIYLFSAFLLVMAIASFGTPFTDKENLGSAGWLINLLFTALMPGVVVYELFKYTQSTELDGPDIPAEVALKLRTRLTWLAWVLVAVAAPLVTISVAARAGFVPAVPAGDIFRFGTALQFGLIALAWSAYFHARDRVMYYMIDATLPDDTKKAMAEMFRATGLKDTAKMFEDAGRRKHQD